MRYTWKDPTLSTTPTYKLLDYTFTGQFSYMDDLSTSEVTEGFGLMYYNARWYDPVLGRFAQADSIIPGAGNPQAWDRYAYGLNNPSRYTDPSGHKIEEGCGCVIPAPKPPSDDGGGNGGDGDPATPWDVGLEWLTGQGPRHHEFGEGDPFTEPLQEHEYLDEVRLAIALRILADDYSAGRMDYDLSGLQGVPKYAKDYSTLLTFGQTGNLAVTFLGSYELDYSVVSVDADSGTAEILIQVENESTLASATHPPVIGYTELWKNTVAPFTDSLVPTGPMSRVTQSFLWTETICYR